MMDKIRIVGGKRLKGAIPIAGAKNAALPLMAASLLADAPLTLTNIPHLTDITTMANLLVELGVTLEVGSVGLDECHTGRKLILDGGTVNSTTAPYDIVRKMRASVVVLGPLLARFGKARVSLPGGCAIGTRPIDYHLKALEQMGAEITLSEGYVEAKLPQGQTRLKAADITFPRVSVGATENVMMAATLADGKTILRNAAEEPEITDLARCLIAMGADIEGVGTSTLTILGVERLHAAGYAVMPDRIEAGTYAIAAGMTNGDITLQNVTADIMEATLTVLEAVGMAFEVDKAARSIRCTLRDGMLRPIEVVTAPYPGFATDMQAQLASLLCLANGRSTITEAIFENRFMHIPELQRMGADITEQANHIIIRGPVSFNAAEVMATDLRASGSLVLAALAAEGETIINRVYHLDRGYERLEEKLAMCGAEIERVRE